LAAGDHSDDNSESEDRALFMEANYNWEYPLSAASFAAWRSRLTNRDDEVALEGSRDSAVYRLRTSTRSSTLEEATLMLRAKDLSIVSGTFRFRNMRLVEMTPLPEGLHPALEHTRIETQHPSVSATSPVGNQGFLKLSGSAEELRVMAALHSANIDRGDQVDLTRDARGRLIVTATGISPERRNTLRNSLSSLPNVSLHFQDDTIDLSKPAEPGSHPVLAPESNIAEPFRLQLQETLGGTAGLARFADHVLETSEAAMVQAYNLRKLAQRFPPEVEAQFDGHDRAMLAQLRQDYAQSLGVKAADLHRLLAPVLVALGAIDGRAEEPPDSPSWQRATELLFSAAQGLDRLVTALLTDGAANDAQNTIEKTNRALRQLKVDLDWYQALIREEVQRHP
jgi:hypothetical protein